MACAPGTFASAARSVSVVAKWIPVAHYFFSLHDRHGETPDEEGRDLPGAGDARIHAITAARELMAEDIRTGRLTLTDYIEVSTRDGEVVLTVPFSDAVTIDS